LLNNEGIRGSLALNLRPITRALFASAAIAAACLLAGCDTDSIAPSGRANAPLSDKMLAELAEKHMDKESPILVRLFKEESELEVWKKNQDGEFALLKTYPICRWSGDLGPKIKEGDRQAPEGFYTITPGQMNPNSNYYLAFNTGYPNAFDRAWGRTGSELMVHGDCSSRGCYAMTDEQMVEIYALARESFFGGQKSFQFQAYPFRMTARNLARHRNNPNLAFWKMLKVGSDHFEVTHQQPKVDVCDRRYVFDAAPPDGSTKPLAFNPRGQCPVYQVPKEIAELVREREQRDGAEYADLVSRNIEVAASHRGIDGGMNPVFLAQIAGSGDGLGAPAAIMTPGALPRSPNQPPAQVVPPAQPVQVASAEDGQPIPANVPVPRSAPQAKVGTAPDSATGLASLIDGIFGGSTANSAPVAAAVQPPSQPAARRSRSAVAQAKPATKPTMQTAAAHPAHAQPKTQTTASPVPALRPRLNAEPAVAQNNAQDRSQDKPQVKPQAEPQAQPKAEPAGEMRTAYSAPVATKSGLLTGAQPVVPAGSFESRWSAFR
jgi:murein L,D-transpeptidase YafK